MRRLVRWSGSRIAAAWVLWPALLVLSAGVVLGVALWRVGAIQAPSGASHTSITFTRLELGRPLLLAAAFFGPPALLTAAWARARHGRHLDPPA